MHSIDCMYPKDFLFKFPSVEMIWILYLCCHSKKPNKKKHMWQSNDEYVLRSWTNLSRLITVTAPLSKTWMLFNPFFWRKCESLYIFQFQGMYTWLLFVSSFIAKIWNFGTSVLLLFINSFDFAQGVIETRFVSLTTTSIILNTMCQ